MGLAEDDGNTPDFSASTEAPELTSSEHTTMERSPRTESDQADDLLAASRRLAAASDARRRRTERELHNGVQQHLALLGLKIALLKTRVRTDPEGAETLCEELTVSLRDALDSLRELAQWVYPAVLENEGLEAAVADACHRLPATLPLTVENVGRHDPELEAALFFACMDALNYAVHRGGPAPGSTLKLSEHDRHLQFELVGDGLVDPFPSGSLDDGLQPIADRMLAFDGELRLQSLPDGMGAIIGSIPLS